MLWLFLLAIPAVALVALVVMADRQPRGWPLSLDLG